MEHIQAVFEIDKELMYQEYRGCDLKPIVRHDTILEFSKKLIDSELFQVQEVESFDTRKIHYKTEVLFFNKKEFDELNGALDCLQRSIHGLAHNGIAQEIVEDIKILLTPKKESSIL